MPTPTTCSATRRPGRTAAGTRCTPRSHRTCAAAAAPAPSPPRTPCCPARRTGPKPEGWSCVLLSQDQRRAGVPGADGAAGAVREGDGAVGYLDRRVRLAADLADRLDD